MSYRITASDGEYDDDFNHDYTIYHQVYGNHESPKLLNDFLESKGVVFDGDGCFYNYDVDNIQELFKVMIEISKERIEDDTFYNLKPSVRYKTDTVDGLLSYWSYQLDSAIVLTEYNFYKAFEPLIESYWDDTDNESKYRIKDGKHIYLSGF